MRPYGLPLKSEHLSRGPVTGQPEQAMNACEVVSSCRLGRRQFMRMCVGSLALAAAGCRRNDRFEANHSTITVFFWGDEQALSPHSYNPAQFLAFLPLVTHNARGELVGRLAESWEHSPDYRTWTIQLRKGLRWHDGVPVTAHDVKFTLDLLSHPKVLMVPPGSFTVTVLDDHAYTISYHTQAIGSPGDDYWTVYYPKHLLEKLDPNQFASWEFWTHPVGNGPYRYSRRVPKTMIEFEANPDYYRGKPKIERVVIKFGETGASGALTELLSRNVDAIPCCYLDAIDLLKLKDDARFHTYYYIQPEKLNAIAWNHRHLFFRDRTVRRALTLAINRRELHQVLNLPANLPILDAFVTERQFLRGEIPTALPYNPGEAKRLLDEAGWRDAGTNGAREKDGKAFRFTALVSRLQEEDKAAVYVQAQLRGVGVQMDISSLEGEAQAQRVKAGEFEASFNVAYLTWPWGGRLFFGEGSLIGYNNPKVVALQKIAQSSMNPEEIEGIYRELVPIFQADLPVTFLYPAVWPTVADRRVRGLSSPVRADPIWYMEDLWLGDD